MANSLPLQTNRVYVSGGWTIQPDSNGNLGVFYEGTEEMTYNPNNTTLFLTNISPGGTMYLGSHVTGYNGFNTVQNGIPAFRGASLRTGLSAVDSVPIIVYVVPSTTGAFRLSATIVGRSGTIASAIATVTYTVAGVAITKTVSITAVDTDSDYTGLLTPDASTIVTVQLTTLTGTSPVVDANATVEGVGTGT